MSDNYSAYAYTYNADNSVTHVSNRGTPTGPHVVLNVGIDQHRKQLTVNVRDMHVDRYVYAECCAIAYGSSDPGPERPFDGNV